MEKVMEVLSKMSYERSYHPTTKKLLHPYRRFLAHVYLVCISGNKSGIDTLTIRQSSGLVSLVEGWKFNYSKCVFDDMVANMILETKYHQLQPTVSIYDTKIMNHVAFSMLNQKPRADAPPRSVEPVENVDLTGIESEDDEVDERMIDNPEVNENVREDET
ncbi:hypothetical protein Hanom_Chr13g01196671 [Helianthus anomalus]